MGTCYFLVRSSDKALFDLGKWHPPKSWHSTEFALPQHSELVDLIAKPFANMGYTPDATAEVARRMIAFSQGGPVVLQDDATHDFDDSRDDGDHLRIVDSRFPDDWSKP